jgi:hypothetical protein
MVHRKYLHLEGTLTHVEIFSNFCLKRRERKSAGQATALANCKWHLKNAGSPSVFSFWWVSWIRRSLPIQERVNKGKALLKAVALAESFAKLTF